MSIGLDILRRVLPNSIKAALASACNPVSLANAMARCQKRNLEIRTVIDIGASDGRWSIQARRRFPDATFLMVEARREHEAALIRAKDKCPRFDYVICAAGDTEGQIYFDATDLFGGLASHTPTDKNCVAVPVNTIDKMVERAGLHAPFLLKLDTHGFEAPIFEGARQTLARTNLIVVEAYNFEIASGCFRFHEMCAYLEARGFRCVDFCDPMFRDRDGALWQMDLFFIRSDRPEFRSNQFE